ncbi:hypothetical protein L2E82_22816 [Cichorium intybus]|uniref:Uncharacterized protein n=1 Tax=Cichorium intybus TaxID=13427 RepID=A0ACB9DYT1_CICIN|nr:hypothetical protein L2E82_22816 [Cichorium intybus]
MKSENAKPRHHFETTNHRTSTIITCRRHHHQVPVHILHRYMMNLDRLLFGSPPDLVPDESRSDLVLERMVMDLDPWFFNAWKNNNGFGRFLLQIVFNCLTMFPCLHLHELELATSLIEKAKSKGVSLLVPSDVVIVYKLDAYANSKVVPANSIPDGWMGLDIGPDSIKSFSESLDTTQTVNGPMGVFEFEKLAVGTEQKLGKYLLLSLR